MCIGLVDFEHAHELHYILGMQIYKKFVVFDSFYLKTTVGEKAGEPRREVLLVRAVAVLEPLHYLLLVSSFELLGEDQIDWAANDFASSVLYVVLEELAHTEDLESPVVEESADIEGLLVEEQSLVDEFALVVVLDELDTLSCEVAVLFQVLELLSVLVDQLFVEYEKAIVNVDILPPLLEAEVLRDEFPFAVGLVNELEVGLDLILEIGDVDAVLADHVPDRQIQLHRLLNVVSDTLEVVLGHDHVLEVELPVKKDTVEGPVFLFK